MYIPKKPRPHQWKMGPDPIKQDMYYTWMKRKAQAKFRKEEWELEWEDFYSLWKDNWHLKGRLADNLCMTRDDFEKPWNKKNTILVTRREHLQNQANFRNLKK